MRRQSCTCTWRLCRGLSDWLRRVTGAVRDGKVKEMEVSILRVDASGGHVYVSKVQQFVTAMPVKLDIDFPEW